MAEFSKKKTTAGTNRIRCVLPIDDVVVNIEAAYCLIVFYGQRFVSERRLTFDALQVKVVMPTLCTYLCRNIGPLI